MKEEAITLINDIIDRETLTFKQKIVLINSVVQLTLHELQTEENGNIQ